jgi:hypothetical protein
MRTFFYLIITSFIATGAMFAGLNQHQPLIGYAIGVGSWAWFFCAGINGKIAAAAFRCRIFTAKIVL